MIKRTFWLVVGFVAAAVGINYIKNKAEENPEQFSNEALVDKFIEIFDRLKIFVNRYWQGVTGGAKLDDTELEKIFETKSIMQTDLKSDSLVKPSDISLN